MSANLPLTDSDGGTASAPPYRLLVVGVGGGGCRAARHVAGLLAHGPTVIAVDSDDQALKETGLPIQLSIGRALTRGFGAGGDAAIGKIAAEDEENKLRTLVEGMDLVFVITTLGGGTGSGAAPVVARIAHEQGALTICFASTPFDFEANRDKDAALEALRQLRMHSDATICLPNQRLLEIVPDQATLKSAFDASDHMISMAVIGIWKLLTEVGLIRLNFSDLKNLVENSGGACSFGYAEGEGPDKAQQATAALLASPLLDHGNVIAQADAFLLNILGGPDLALLDVQRVMNNIKQVARRDAKIFMGATVDDDWQGRLMVTVLAAEHWVAGPQLTGKPVSVLPPEPAVAPVALAIPEQAAGSDEAAPAQKELVFEKQDRGRFDKVEPTIYGNEDLDVPTFHRRGIKILSDRG
ncbi:MAG: cell division protein FtsZ [Kiritimatiellaeota bacterium]|nr:cell division protein FtsZ [Kiritimatiellota bacterium]